MLLISLFIGVDRQVNSLLTGWLLAKWGRCFLSEGSIWLDTGDSVGGLLGSYLIGSASTGIELLSNCEIVVAVNRIRIAIAVQFIFIQLLNLFLLYWQLHLFSFAILPQNTLLAGIFGQMSVVPLKRINCDWFLQCKVFVRYSNAWYFWRVKWIGIAFGRVQLAEHLILFGIAPRISECILVWWILLALIIKLGLRGYRRGRRSWKNSLPLLLNGLVLTRMVLVVLVVRLQYFEVVLLFGTAVPLRQLLLRRSILRILWHL